MAEPCVKEQDRTWAKGECKLRQTARCEERQVVVAKTVKWCHKAPGTLSSQETC